MRSKKKDCDGRGSSRAGELRVTRAQHPRAPRPPRDDSGAINAIEGYIDRNPQHGFDKVYLAVRGENFCKCRLYLVYKALKFNIKRRGKEGCQHESRRRS